MSKNTTNNIPLICHKCGCVINVNFHSHVDDSMSEEITRIIDGSFFTRKCEKCGESIVLNFPVGYHNIKTNKDVLFLPINTNAQSQSISIPDNARVTHELFAFIEKVRISEMGLDDKIIELVKVVAYNQVSELGKVPGESLESIGCGVKDDKSLELDLRCGGRHYLLEVPYQMYLDVEGKFGEILKRWQEPKVVDMNWSLMFLNAMLIEECETIQDVNYDDWDEIIF